MMPGMTDCSKSPGSVQPDPFAWVKEKPFFQAGLAGYSDTAMRLVARRHGAPYCVTEAMLDHFLIHGGKGLDAARLEAEDHPIAGQLMGSHPAEIARGAEILLELGYDVIDINLACPVKKIRRKSRGGHLLAVPDEAIAILEEVRRTVGDRVPLSVKLRRAYDDEPGFEEAFHRILSRVIELGYRAATVHARTVMQKYIGPSRWPFLTALTARYADAMRGGFLIFGSGDIFSPQAVFDMIRQTGVNGVSVARGCIGNPWIFRQVTQIGRGEEPSAPGIAEQRAVLLEHFELAVRLHGEKLAGRTMRKFGIRFSEHHPDRENVRRRFIAVETLADWRGVLDECYGDQPVPA